MRGVSDSGISTNRGRIIIVAIDADRQEAAARCTLQASTERSSIERLEAAAGHTPLLVAGDLDQGAVLTLPDVRDLYLVGKNIR